MALQGDGEADQLPDPSGAGCRRESGGLFRTHAQAQCSDNGTRCFLGKCPQEWGRGGGGCRGGWPSLRFYFTQGRRGSEVGPEPPGQHTGAARHPPLPRSEKPECWTLRERPGLVSGQDAIPGLPIIGSARLQLHCCPLFLVRSCRLQFVPSVGRGQCLPFRPPASFLLPPPVRQDGPLLLSSPAARGSGTAPPELAAAQRQGGEFARRRGVTRREEPAWWAQGCPSTRR